MKTKIRMCLAIPLLVVFLIAIELLWVYIVGMLI